MLLRACALPLVWAVGKGVGGFDEGGVNRHSKQVDLLQVVVVVEKAMVTPSHRPPEAIFGRLKGTFHFNMC